MGAAEKRDNLPELVDAKRVREWLCLDEVRNVYDMVGRGELPSDCIVKLSPRRLRFDAVRLRAWIADKRVSSRESP